MKKITITIEDDGTLDYNSTNVTNPFKRVDNGWVGGRDICASCPNNPKNGGSGICLCAIPSMYGPLRVTC